MHSSFGKWSTKGLVLVLVLTAGIVLYLPPASATSTLFDDLVSYWDLNETSGTRVDSVVDSGNDLTDNNTVGAVLHGPVGPVGDFITPVLHEYVPTQLQKDSYNTGTSTGNFSLAAWVNLNEAQKADPAWIVGFYSDSDGWPLAYLYWSGTKFQFKVYDAINEEEITVELDLPSGGGWRLIVGRYTSADITLHLSADAGTEVTQALNVGGQRQSFGGKPFRVGAEETIDTYFTGQIGPVGLWTGTNGAISDSQRTSIFNSGNGKLYADLSAADKTSLTGWWDLTEVSGNRANSIALPSGTLTEACDSVDGVANPGGAMDGNAASFVAADSEYLSKTSPSGLGGTGDFTMAVWFKYTANPAADAVIFGSADGVGSYIAHQSGYVKGFVYDAGDESYVNTGEALDVGDRSWHLALLQYTSADTTVSFSLDNGAFTTTELSIGPRGVINGTLFAGGTGAAGSYLDGLIDEASIWNRVLTADEITELYNSGVGTTYADITADTTDPVLTPISIVSNNATNTTAVVGNTITLSFTSDEALASASVTFLSGGDPITNAATVASTSNDELNWATTYVVHADDTTGTVTFTIKPEDLAGNDGTTYNATTDATAVTFALSSGGGSSCFGILTAGVSISGGSATAADAHLYLDNAGMDQDYAYSVTCITHALSASAISEYTQTWSGDCDANGSVIVSGGSKACTAVYMPTSVPGDSPIPTPAPSGGSLEFAGLNDGDTIFAPGSNDPDVYIVNEWGFKRLFLNPVIFGFYGHLGGFSAVKPIASLVRDLFPTSGLFRNCETNDQKVYAVQVTGEDTGILHHVNLSGSDAVAQDPNFFKKVFCINTNEFNWYTQGADYTSPSEVPVYSRH